jgi:formate dehydrogenase iron-sulfur subunit
MCSPTNEEFAAMKAMTCRQLGGPCDAQHRGEDANAVIKAQDKHPKEMVAAGDAAQETILRDLCDTMKYGSLCALGGFTPYPVLSALDFFPEDFGVRHREAAE